MNVQEKTDIDGDAMLLISKEMCPGGDSARSSFDKSDASSIIINNNGDDILLPSPLQDLDYRAFPREAQCRCHLSYSCDYRTVEVRWKSLVPRNQHQMSNSTISPPTNCCHWDCSTSQDHHHHHQAPSSSSFSSKNKRNMQNLKFPSNPTTTTATTTTTTTTTTPSTSSTAIIGLRRRRYSFSSPSSSSSSSSTTSLTSAPVTNLQSTVGADGVGVEKSSLQHDQCPTCNSLKEDRDFLNKTNNNNKNNIHNNNFCDLNWRWRRARTHLEAQDFSVTTMSLWKWEFTSKVRRFMARFSGRRRRSQRRALNSFSGYPWARMTSFLYVIFVVVTGCLRFQSADACSSRSTPKPRPPSPTLRPNITIQTYTCPPEYAAHYCLNGATCFTVKIGESILYNCECAEGYMGQRCEFKDLDGSYLPSKQRAMLEQAGITSGVAIMVVFVIIVCFYLYVRSRRKVSRRGNGQDAVDSFVPEPRRRPFSGIHSSAPAALPPPPSTLPLPQCPPTTTLPSNTVGLSSGSEPKMTDGSSSSLPSPTNLANNSSPTNHHHQHQHHSTSNSSGTTKSSPVLVKATILPSTQTRLCV